MNITPEQAAEMQNRVSQLSKRAAEKVNEHFDLSKVNGIGIVSEVGPQKFMVAPKPRKAKTTPTRPHIGTTFIGVDPALRAGGFWVCIICRVDNTATFKSCKHMGEFVRILQDCEPAAVKVENSNLQKPMFDKKGGVGIALSVGKNQGVSQAAADIADQYSEIPSGISPKQKGAKVTNDLHFQGIVKANGLTLTKYKGGKGIGQDQRDCFMLGLIAEQQYKLHLRVKR